MCSKNKASGRQGPGVELPSSLPAWQSGGKTLPWRDCGTICSWMIPTWVARRYSEPLKCWWVRGY